LKIRNLTHSTLEGHGQTVTVQIGLADRILGNETEERSDGSPLFCEFVQVIIAGHGVECDDKKGEIGTSSRSCLSVEKP
jgi:hypothetical protein